MSDIYKIGPFLISYKMLVIVLAGVIGYLTLLFLLKRVEINKRVVLDIVSSSIMILILTWKFGGVLFNPKQLFSNPLLILFLTGNNSTLLLGFCISAVYILYKLKNKGVPRNLFLDLISLSALPFLFIYNLLIPEYGYATRLPWGISLGSEKVAYHPTNIYFSIAIGIIMVYAFKSNRSIGNCILFIKTSLLIGISGLLLTFLEPQLNYLMGISLKQWIFLLIIVSGFFAHYKPKK